MGAPAMRVAAFCGLGGLVLAAILIAVQGAGAVFATLATGGFGLVLAALFHFVPMAVNAHAWRILLPHRRRLVSLRFFTWSVWAREAVNGLLPVARIGGEVVSARLLIQHGIAPAPAVASLVVDMTLSIVTQFVFTILGLALVVTRTGDLAIAGSVALGLLAMIPAGIAFFVVQRYGLFVILAKLFRAVMGGRLDFLVGRAGTLDRAVRVIYQRPGRVLWCSFWQFGGWVVTAGELWLALYFLGHPTGIADCVLMESITQAVSSAAFVVPAAIGVQEGGFLVIGNLVGLSPETALALALARRGRDLLIFIPALVAWQAKEGRRLIGAGR